MKVAVSCALAASHMMLLTSDFKVGNKSHADRDFYTSDAVLLTVIN